MNKKILQITILSFAMLLSACGYTDPFAEKSIDDIIAMNPQLSPATVQDYYKRMNESSAKVAEAEGNPDAVEFYLDNSNETARMRDYLGDTEGAIRIYKNSLKKHPDWSVGWNNIAVLYENTGDYKNAEKARISFLNVLGASPTVQTYVDLAKIQAFQLDKSPAALKTIADGEKKLGENAEFYFALSNIYKKLNNTKLSEYNLKKYNETKLQSPGIDMTNSIEYE